MKSLLVEIFPCYSLLDFPFHAVLLNAITCLHFVLCLVFWTEHVLETVSMKKLSLLALLYWIILTPPKEWNWVMGPVTEIACCNGRNWGAHHLFARGWKQIQFPKHSIYTSILETKNRNPVTLWVRDTFSYVQCVTSNYFSTYFLASSQHCLFIARFLKLGFKYISLSVFTLPAVLMLQNKMQYLSESLQLTQVAALSFSRDTCYLTSVSCSRVSIFKYFFISNALKAALLRVCSHSKETLLLQLTTSRKWQWGDM